MQGLRTGLLVVLVGASQQAVAQAEHHYRFAIVRQSLAQALTEFSRETGLQIVRISDSADSTVLVNQVVGEYSVPRALELLLAGSGYQYRFVNDHTVAIVKAPPEAQSSASQEQQPPEAKQQTDRGKDNMTKSSGTILAGECRPEGQGAGTGPCKRPGILTRLAAVLFACGALADNRNACAEDTSGELQEVVVTAQRQQESLQKAPVAITAVSGELFQRLGGSDVSALQMAAPDVQISLTGSGGGQIGIRGITTANGTDVGDPAVLFEVDGVYQARAQTTGSVLFDVDRIEVLRGPQGTLYGRNATTGVINVITKKPTQEFTAEGYVEGGNYGAVTGFGALNAPLSDTVAVRASFISVNHDPYFHNGLPDSQNYWDQHENAGRVHLSIKPTSDLSVLLTGEYGSQTGTGSPLVVAYPTVPLSSDPYSFPISEPGSLNLRQEGANALVDWKVPFGTLTYDGGLHQSNMYQLSGANGTQPSVTLTLNPLKSRTQQHELRLSDSTDTFKYVTGLYYFQEHQVWNVFVNPAIAFLMPYEEQDSKAAFAQGTYSITSDLRVTLGARYTKDHKTRTGGDYGYDANDQPSILLVPNFADIHSSKFNYRLGADYDLAPTSMLYASYATGYKAGGFFDGVPPNNTYAPENVSSAEIGLKNRFLNNRLQLNLAAFHYRYTDFQVSYQDKTTLITRTYNAQEALNTGLEIEAEAAPDDNDRIGLSLTYLHARYARFDLPGGAVDTYGFSSYTGKTLPYAPDWGINIDFGHTWRLPKGRKLTAAVLSHWQSLSQLEFHNFPNTQQGAYSKTDLNLTWGDEAGHYAVTAFVRNAENKAVLTSAALESSTDPNAPTAGTLAPPRTYGLRINFAL